MRAWQLGRPGSIVFEFFALAAFACLLVDRDRSREALAWKDANDPAELGDAYGPDLGWRPWRWASGFLLACLVATKWSGLVFIAIFGLMTVLWDVNARRRAGHASWLRGALLRDAPPAFAAIAGTPLVIYTLSWSGWFYSSLGYDRHWADSHPASGLGHLVPGVLRSWVQYHRDIWAYTAEMLPKSAWQARGWLPGWR